MSGWGARGGAALSMLLAITPGAAQEPDGQRDGQQAAVDGPTADYWQQEVHYTVEGHLDEQDGVLHAAAIVEYRNASPDTLSALYFHLYLNAFRPNSLWARNEQRAAYDFQSLREPDYGYGRLRSARIAGSPITAAAVGAELPVAYPHAPDSTVVRIDLPEPLAPGESLALRLEWDARPSTLCRRQCRRGRHYDFAQWYPRIAAYDRYGWQAHPLYPQGEFYGEFATFDVTLDLAADQVIGATGVAVEGDPGWEDAAAAPEDSVTLQRDWYAEPHVPRSPGFLSGDADAGRKRVRFYAEDVHHFAWSVDPEFIYEQARLGAPAETAAGPEPRDAAQAPDAGASVEPREGAPPPVVLRVLYLPGDEEEWSAGRVLVRMDSALSYLEATFGPYPWPQYTVLHRLEGGGTEFPMLVMNGGASLGLVMHETAHQYVHGIFANNEWEDGWLDEGFATFLTRDFFRRATEGTREAAAEGGDEDGAAAPGPAAGPLGYRRLGIRMSQQGRLWGGILQLDELDLSQPVSLVSEDFADFSTYGAMIYSKGSLVLELLRYRVEEENFARALREYYRRWRLKHVDEVAFRRVMEDIAQDDLSGFFGRWLHGLGSVDYSLASWEVRPSRPSAGDGAEGDAVTARGGAGDVEPTGAGAGTWTTAVEIEREGEFIMPVEVAAIRGADTAFVRSEGRTLRETVTLHTGFRPQEVVLDPHDRIMDANPSNNAEGALGVFPRLRFTPHWPLLDQASRSHYLVRVRPELWYNDVDHAKVGVRFSGDLFGWRKELEAGLWVGAGSGTVDFLLGYSDLTDLLGRSTASASVRKVEGRTRLQAGLEWDPARSISDFGETRYGVRLDVLWAHDTTYLRPGRWSLASTFANSRSRSGTGELAVWFARRLEVGSGDLEISGVWGNGIATKEIVEIRGVPVGGGGLERRDISTFEYVPYGRADLEAVWSRELGERLRVRGRLFGGVVYGYDASEPPFPRQRLLFAAGGGPYEALANPFVRSRGALFVRDPDFQYHVPGGGGLRGFASTLAIDRLLAVNAELGHEIPIDAWPIDELELAGFVDAGWTPDEFSTPSAPGFEDGAFLADAGIGVRLQGPLTFRVDFPLWVNRPELAVGEPGTDEFDARWVFSFERAF